MAANQSTSALVTSQDTTTINGVPPVPELQGNALYPPAGPMPAGTRSEAVEATGGQAPANSQDGVGIEGEEVVWEAAYAMKNFLGRITARALLTLGWIALAIYTWGYHTSSGGLVAVTVVAGVVLAGLWLALGYRILQARFGHHYRLTTRRLFVSSGLMRRRRDMLELLRVKDVFTRQTLVERWLSLGTVVVVSSDHDLPAFYLTGVNDPKGVMDLVWHHARSERDRRSVKVESV